MFSLKKMMAMAFTTVLVFACLWSFVSPDAQGDDIFLLVFFLSFLASIFGNFLSCFMYNIKIF